MSRGWIGVVAAALVLAAGCSGSRTIVDGQPIADPDPPSGSGYLALRVTRLPGILPPGGIAGTPPQFSLYGDGQLVTASTPETAGSWPELREQRVDSAALRRFYAAGRAAVLASPVGRPVADEPSLAITVPSAGDHLTHLVPATGPAAEQLLAALRPPAGGGVGYRPVSVAVVAVPITGAGGGKVMPWPFAPLEGLELGDYSRGSWCTVLTGTAIGRARQATAAASPNTAWRSDDRLWTVRFRPLLPDEQDCRDL